MQYLSATVVHCVVIRAWIVNRHEFSWYLLLDTRNSFVCESDRGVREISQYLLNYRGTAVQNSMWMFWMKENLLIVKVIWPLVRKNQLCTDHSRCLGYIFDPRSMHGQSRCGGCFDNSMSVYLSEPSLSNEFPCRHGLGFSPLALSDILHAISTNASKRIGHIVLTSGNIFHHKWCSDISKASTTNRDEFYRWT